jgi:hypothetical protein
MTREEQYIFDLQGYLVVKGALDPDEVDALNDADALYHRPVVQI